MEQKPEKEVKRITFADIPETDVNENKDGNGIISQPSRFQNRRHSNVLLVNQKKYVEPPDGGWGWVIVAAVWLDNALVLGMLRSMGVLFPEFRSEFSDYPSSAIAWINSISLSMRATAAPLSAALSNKYGEQKVVACGAVLVVLGLILSNFATSPVFLYISLGCITGVGFAFASLPALTMIGRYFKKRRSLANGLSRSGGGATFFLAPLLRYLVDQYGWRGCLLIVGALELNLFVVAKLLRSLRLKEELAFDSATTLRRHSIRKTEMPPEEKEVHEQFYKRKISEKDRVRQLQKSLEKKIKEDGVTESLIVEHFPQIEPVYQPAKKKTLKFSLLKNPLWLILTINLVVTQFGYSITLVHLVARATNMGMGDYESVFLLSYVGLTEVTAQLSSGFIADKISVRKINLHKFYILIMAGATLMSLFVSSYAGLTAYCVLFGLGSGSWQGNILPVTVDTLGIVNLRSAYGFCLFFSGCVGQMLGPPTAGALFDATGTYHTSFVLAFSCFLFASLVLMLEIPVSRCWRARGAVSDPEKTAGKEHIDDIFSELEDVTHSRNFVA